MQNLFLLFFHYWDGNKITQNYYGFLEYLD